MPYRPARWRSGVLLTAAFALTQSACAHTTQPASAWWTFQADVPRPGTVPPGTLAFPPQLVWDATLFAGTHSLAQAVVGDGHVYVAAGNGSVHALALATGAPVWSYPAATLLGSATVPAAANAHVYVAPMGTSPSLVALTSAGVLAWQTPLAAPSRAPVAVADGRIFVNTDQHRLYAFDQQSGAQLWSAATAPGATSQESAPAAGFGRVFVGSDDGLYAFDPASGAQLWHYTTPAVVGFSSPVLRPAAAGVPDLVYIGDNAGTLHAVDAATGAQAWSYQGAATLAFSTVAFADGRVVLLDFTRVKALDAATGALLWDVNLGVIPRYASAVTDGVIYVVSDDLLVRGLRLSNGTQVWSAPVPGNGQASAPFAPPSIAAGLLLVPSRGHVYAFGAGAGPACVDFGPPQPPLGTTWSAPAQTPGQQVLVQSGIPVRVETFQHAAGTAFNLARVEAAPAGFGAGHVTRLNNISLELDFTGLAFTPQTVTAEWRSLGGTENLSANGAAPWVGPITGAPAAIAPGVTLQLTSAPVPGGFQGSLTLKGSVQEMRIGGQELWLDRVCATP